MKKNSFVVQCVLLLKESAYIRKICMCNGTEPRGVETLLVYDLFCRQFHLVVEKFNDCFINHSVLLKTTGFVNTLYLVVSIL